MATRRLSLAVRRHTAVGYMESFTGASVGAPMLLILVGLGRDVTSKACVPGH